MDVVKILHKYIDNNDDLYRLLYSHSRSVADKSLCIIEKHPEWKVDKTFVEEAAMLHDIGIVKTDAPEIFCYGKFPYICHGYLGAEILMAEGLPRHALVCERHTGVGLSLKEIVNQSLPLPHRDMCPQSLEEQIICFADTFFSKTHLGEERSVEAARKKIEKFGEEPLLQFDNWCERFL